VNTADTRTGRHYVLVLHTHLVFVTKYRHEVFAGPDRRETDTTVTGHHRGHTMRGRRVKRGVPGHLPVIVRVDVNEPGSDQQTRRVDHLGRVGAPGIQAAPRANHRDDTVLDPDIGPVRGCAGTVDDGTPDDLQVVHLRLPEPAGTAESLDASCTALERECRWCNDLGIHLDLLSSQLVSLLSYSALRRKIGLCSAGAYDRHSVWVSASRPGHSSWPARGDDGPTGRVSSPAVAYNRLDSRCRRA
jgi:hypothetical protein